MGVIFDITVKFCPEGRGASRSTSKLGPNADGAHDTKPLYVTQHLSPLERRSGAPCKEVAPRSPEPASQLIPAEVQQHRSVVSMFWIIFRCQCRRDSQVYLAELG